jgi:hypothetical protein
MSTAVLEILKRIDELSESDRLQLQLELARKEEQEWAQLSSQASAQARAQGLDDASIAQAVESLRYGNRS